MKTQPIIPARVDFDSDTTPSAPDFGDVYHARAGAQAQARQVFMQGNGLPERWQGRTRFVILETGFGLGNNFLATWAAWREDPLACERLVFISIEKHPLRLDDLRRAHAHSPTPALAEQLIEAWPPLTHNLHRLVFEQGRVQLLLGLGDVRDWLKELVAEVDAFYLDGFSPAKNPEMWDPYALRALARLAAEGATAATWSVARGVREGLSSAGFVVDRVPGFASKGQMCVARFEPRHRAQKPAARQALAPRARRVLVLGAGLAGAACARALHEQGLQVEVLDAAHAPATQGSGNPGGLFHGTVNPDDGLHARFNRAAALETASLLKRLGPQLPWLQRGMLRLETRRALPDMQALLQKLGLPPDYVDALDAEEVRVRSGLQTRHPAWFYPGGGALPPVALVRLLLQGIEVRTGADVASIRHDGEQWCLLDRRGHPLDRCEALVLALGKGSLDLLPPLLNSPRHTRPGGAQAVLTPQRGQISHLPAASAWPTPRMPIAGAGYALPDLQGGLWCGATAQDGDEDAELRWTDHQANLAQYQQMSGHSGDPGLIPLSGRCNWRLLSHDRLPWVGGLARPDAGGRTDQVRFIPRLPGLAVCTALGSRGIGWASLCGQLLAAQMSGSPAPMESSLIDAVDPMRIMLP